jgi:hypothetical protein
MNTFNNSIHLTLIHPDDTLEKPITPISNEILDDLFDFRNSDYISPVSDGTVDLYPERGKIEDLYIEPAEIVKPDINYNYKIGDGKMEYIKDKSDREMFTNAWKAITFTNNWDFVRQQTDSFVLTKDPRIYEITEKMEELGYKVHSGISFSLTMRSMQYLLHYGEEEFKKMF